MGMNMSIQEMLSRSLLRGKLGSSELDPRQQQMLLIAQISKGIKYIQLHFGSNPVSQDLTVIFQYCMLCTGKVEVFPKCTRSLSRLSSLHQLQLSLAIRRSYFLLKYCVWYAYQAMYRGQHLRRINITILCVICLPCYSSRVVQFPFTWMIVAGSSWPKTGSHLPPFLWSIPSGPNP